MKNTIRMSCGNCGKNLFHVEADDDDSPRVLVFECTHCYSRTIYTLKEPTIQKSKGIGTECTACFLG